MVTLDFKILDTAGILRMLGRLLQRTLDAPV